MPKLSPLLYYALLVEFSRACTIYLGARYSLALNGVLIYCHKAVCMGRGISANIHCYIYEINYLLLMNYLLDFGHKSDVLNRKRIYLIRQERRRRTKNIPYLQPSLNENVMPRAAAPPAFSTSYKNQLRPWWW